MEDLKKEVFIEILDGILENPYIGIILVDTLGNINKVNKTYLEILGLSEDDVLNKHVLEVMPHSRLPEVLRTRSVHLADYWPINGHDTIVFRMPLYKDEKLIGAMGQSLVLGATGAKLLSKKLKDLERELTVYKDVVSTIYRSKYCFDNIVGEDETMRNVKSIAQRAANTGSTVLIMGESGTGKELFANAIHQASPRKDRPFVRVNCAALPDNLLESELFGYEEGAFTGARKGGKGLICLSSTFSDKEGKMQSRIKPILAPGAIVTVPRSLNYYVVSEYGIAMLKSKSTWERAEALINIAHPDLRDELIKEADANKIWVRSNKIS